MTVEAEKKIITDIVFVIVVQESLSGGYGKALVSARVRFIQWRGW